MAGAAFIDLDRTLLSGASGPAISAALRSTKLVPQSVPGESLLYRVFNTVGETLPSMLLARQGATAMKGKSQRIVREAVATAIPELNKLVQPFARTAIEQHRANGDKVVLATTTPYDFIEQFARSLGFDDVIATRYEVDAGGLYTGELDSRFVWSGGKLASVSEWCSNNGVSLTDRAAAQAASNQLADENTLRIMSAISNLLPPEAREHREPTEAELRAALPSNYKGDPNAEFTRRPGTD